MTRPITVMEWLCYSWLHTAVCSHSHSPPVQRHRQRHTASQTHVCLVCLSHTTVPHPSDNIETMAQSHRGAQTSSLQQNRNTTVLCVCTVRTCTKTVIIQDPAGAEKSIFKFCHIHTYMVESQAHADCGGYVYMHVITFGQEPLIT